MSWRGLTIGKAWSVLCPSELSSCYYDCNEAPECKVSLEPTRVRHHAQGSWMHVPLPTPWSAASLLFSSTVRQCVVVNCADQASALLSLSQAEVDAQCSGSSDLYEAWFVSACVHLQTAGDCEQYNFGVSEQTNLAIASPTTGQAPCLTASNILGSERFERIRMPRTYII